ncbi:MAG: hypothetical protein AAF623_01065 [Planctomycetota bacterium]
MRINIINSIANVFTRFGVNAVDMLFAGNDPVLHSMRLQICTAGPISGRHSRTSLLLGYVSRFKTQPAYLDGWQEPAKQTLEPVTGQIFQVRSFQAES